MMSKTKFYILIAAGLLGFLIIMQGRSFENLDELLGRDNASNVFQEIKILKEKNEDLKKEIDELENTLDQFTDQNQALAAIQDQIDKYTKLSGGHLIFGPGVTVEIDGKITTPWAIDLVNELFNLGAQSVSVNGIRITNKTTGFDTLPKGQILLNGSILSPPYLFNALGESSTLKSLLESPGAIVARLKTTFPGIKIDVSTKDIIQME